MSLAQEQAASDNTADRQRAQATYEKLRDVLNMYSGLKGYNRKMMQEVGNAGEAIMKLLDRAFAGDMRALGFAESALRGLEAAYYLSPHDRRRAVQTTIQQTAGSQTGQRSEAQEILDAIRGPTGWKRYGDLILTAAITAAVTAIVTALVVRYVIGA
jgi:hypothetical protein